MLIMRSKLSDNMVPAHESSVTPYADTRFKLGSSMVSWPRVVLKAQGDVLIRFSKIFKLSNFRGETEKRDLAL